jgi:hypothetical protein
LAHGVQIRIGLHQGDHAGRHWGGAPRPPKCSGDCRARGKRAPAEPFHSLQGS